MFNVIITVPEEWTDYERLKNTCDHLLSNKVNSGEKITVVLSDKGSLAERYANEKGYSLMFLPIDWKYGKSSGYVRNSQLVDLSNACIAFFSSYGKNYQQQSLVNICTKKQKLFRQIDED